MTADRYQRAADLTAADHAGVGLRRTPAGPLPGETIVVGGLIVALRNGWAGRRELAARSTRMADCSRCSPAAQPIHIAAVWPGAWDEWCHRARSHVAAVARGMAGVMPQGRRMVAGGCCCLLDDGGESALGADIITTCDDRCSSAAARRLRASGVSRLFPFGSRYSATASCARSFATARVAASMRPLTTRGSRCDKSWIAVPRRSRTRRKSRPSISNSIRALPAECTPGPSHNERTGTRRPGCRERRYPSLPSAPSRWSRTGQIDWADEALDCPQCVQYRPGASPQCADRPAAFARDP